MPPRRPTRPVPPDIDALRSALSRGKIVRVGIATSGQFPSGAIGRVRRIGDPTLDGDEFVFVEVPVNGAKDTLPFAPSDLSAAPTRSRTSPPTTGSIAGPGKPVGSATSARSGPAGRMTGEPRKGGPKAPVDQPALPEFPGQSPEESVQPASRPAARTAAAGRTRRAPVTITVSTTGEDGATWQIEARIGVKAAVRPTQIPPSRVWEIVRTLDEPKLTAVVRSILDEHRRTTQARADALTAQLSALQSELRLFPGVQQG